MKERLVVLLLCLTVVSFFCCQEVDEGVDDEIDLIVRNVSENDLWITVDDVPTGKVDNNGIAITVWDGIEAGVHTIRAYLNEDYSGFYCAVETGYLNGDDDFYWYLEENQKYSGTKSGDC